MKAIFFDACVTTLAKNLKPIADMFNVKEDNFSAIFLSAEVGSNVDPEIEKEAKKKILSEEKYSLVYFSSFNAKKIENFLVREKPDFFFVDAIRVYDQLWIGICTKFNIPVFKVLHGFIIDYINYKPVAMISKYKKMIRLVYAIYNISKIEHCSFIKLFYQYCRFILRGTPLKDTLLSNLNLHPKVVFVYSDYYKDLWERKYGYPRENMEVIMPADLLLVKRDRKSTRLNSSH